MREFLKRLFGRSAGATPASAASVPPERRTRSHTEHETSRGQAPTASGHTGEAAVHRYFELSSIIEQAKADGNFRGAIRAARDTYPVLPAVVRQMKKEYGSFDLRRSHAVHTASTLMAVMGDREGIRELRNALTATRELRDWLPAAEDAEADAASVDQIVAAVAAKPGLAQSELKNCINAKDGRRIGILAASLEKGKRLQRVKKGSTYFLYPSGYRLTASASSAVQEAATPPATSSVRAVPAFRRSRPRSAVRARPLTLKNLPYVRLPKAPHAWTDRHENQTDVVVEACAGTKAQAAGAKQPRSAAPHFVVSGNGWVLANEETLTPAERPDPAFRHVFPTASSTLWLDPKGRRTEFPTAPAIALMTDRAGAPLAERGLAYDVYRTDVNSDGSGVLFLSREGVLHGYTERLEGLVLERVVDMPEYVAQANRFGIQPDDLKNHTRCVAISTDRLRYLVTIVDEAWCYDTKSGEPLWGLRFPGKEGWTEIAADRSDRSGTSAEIDAALQLMELGLPVSPEDITRQYRALARRWHPDRNPQDPDATRKFQNLSAAMELLSGADLSKLSGEEIERVRYEQVLRKSSVTMADGRTLTVSISMQTGGAFGADWIYAANFARAGHGAFLAGYSGRVVEVDGSGIPLRIYDIGSVPRHIAETPSHLYILTDTRLYVLHQESLDAVVDVFEQGSLIVGDTGFGLLEPKRFQWFTPTGRPLGLVETRDPIRRTYSGPAGLVVETRMRRALINGAPSWW